MTAHGFLVVERTPHAIHDAHPPLPHYRRCPPNYHVGGYTTGEYWRCVHRNLELIVSDKWRNLVSGMPCGSLLGFPFHAPLDAITREPAPHHHLKGIQLGDVGYIRRGGFVLLFFAGSSLDKVKLGNNVPRTFKPLDVGPIFRAHPRSPEYLSTDTVQEIPARASIYPYVRSVASSPSSTSDACHRTLEPGSSISFQLTGDQGAALLTKYPTYGEDVVLGRTFEEYTKEHYNSWVVFARERGHPSDIKPILVTGVDVTRDFAMVAYSNDGDDMTAKFTVSASGVSPWGTWRTPGMVYKSCGPQLRCPPPAAQATDLVSFGSSHTEAISDEYDQCIFVRYYTMRKRLGIPRFMKAAAGPHDLGTGPDDERSPLGAQCRSDPDSDTMSSLFDDDGYGSRSPATSSDSGSDTVVHNTPAVRLLFPHSHLF